MKAADLNLYDRFILTSDPSNVWQVEYKATRRGGRVQIGRRWISGDLENAPQFKHKLATH